MIDTIRLSGPASFYKFSYDYERYFAYKTKDGWEKTVSVQVEKNEKYRVYYNPGYDRIDVELNLQKVLFNANCYNYALSSYDIGRLVRGVHNSFFTDSSGFISRIDLGGVVNYGSYEESIKALEKYRGARFLGATVAKYRQQNYATSVFYPSKHWSLKVYLKGIEQRIVNKDYLAESSSVSRGIYGVDVCDMLRFEKTYRFRELERLGMTCVARNGIPIDSFNADLVYKDFMRILSEWDFSQSPSFITAKGTVGFLQLLDQKGLLGEAEAQYLVSRSARTRLRKLKQEQVDFRQKEFILNFPQKYVGSLNYCLMFGPQSLLFTPKT